MAERPRKLLSRRWAATPEGNQFSSSPTFSIRTTIQNPYPRRSKTASFKSLYQKHSGDGHSSIPQYCGAGVFPIQH
jgi:hypothetical protein